MKTAVVYNKKINNTKKTLTDVCASLDSVGLDYEIVDLDNLKSGFDMVCAIGGDGTILKASRYYAQTSTPVMGINLGRLGFLSLFSSTENIGTVIKEQKYTIRERMMLRSFNHTALNDIVIKGSSGGRTSRFNLYINETKIGDYIADGIIISTPTGSTAYGLSAGGPVLHPGFDAMVIVPICAHTMTARPLVVPAKEIIRIKSLDEMLDVTFDGQTATKEVNEVVVEHSEKKSKLVFPQNYKFYSVLHDKLHWGISPISEE